MDSFFQNLSKVYIVGAASRAKTLTGYLSNLYPSVVIVAYLVDVQEENEASINGVPVQILDDKAEFFKEYPVLIATKGIYHDDICKHLKMVGFTNIYPVTPEVDNYLRNAYVKSVFEKEGREFCKLEHCMPTEYVSYKMASIYMAKSIYDKPLQGEYHIPYYEKAIQVGMDLTEQRLWDCDYADNMGENISNKNRQYCELTAMYWIWKNALEEIVGLSHYRRHFVLSKDWQARMEENDFDVILPVPTYVQPSVYQNYRERHGEEELIQLFSFLEQRDIEDYYVAKEVFAGNLYYPCNMFIMKKEVLDELCKWLFPALAYVVENIGSKEDVYLNRYPGFLSERLITVFFTRYRKKYKIVFTDKIFIS